MYRVQDDKPVVWLGDAVAIVDFLTHATSEPGSQQYMSLIETGNEREEKCHLSQETSKVITANQLNENGLLLSSIIYSNAQPTALTRQPHLQAVFFPAYSQPR